MKNNHQKKIVIAGGTGFAGRFLTNKFHVDGFEVVIISRNGMNVPWQHDALVAALNNAGLLINLAGRSIDCRHNKKNKRQLLASRLETTSMLGKAITECSDPPPLWINASGASIYGNSLHAMTEDDPAKEETFMAEVASRWEACFFSYGSDAFRQVALRMGVILGKDGGSAKPLKMLVRLGLGGKQGNGQQMFSWIHVEDIYYIIRFLQEKEYISGPVNGTAPGVVTNKELMQTFRKIMKMPFGIPSASWMVKIGAFIIQTEASLLLDSVNVQPKVLLQTGYQFRYPDIEGALRAC